MAGWTEISRSQHPHERAALEALRAKFPENREPFYAWSNLEFTALDGSNNEVDLLLISPRGMFVIEIKDWHGQVDCGQMHWLRKYDDGRERTVDNPLRLADLKAKRLKSMLERERKIFSKKRPPFVQSAVLLSNSSVNVSLTAELRGKVFLLDKSDELAIFPQLLRADQNTPPHHRVDRPTAKAVARALDAIGLKPSTRLLQVGPNVLGELIEDDGGAYQDYLAHPENYPDLTRRVRIYSPPLDADAQERRQLQRAARREFQVLRALHHPNIVRVSDQVDHDLGPAVVFEHERGAVRLGDWIRERRRTAEDQPLDLDTQLELATSLCETLRYAHQQGLHHRCLTPDSIWVHGPETASPKLVVADWFLAQNDATDLSRHSTSTRHDLLLDDRRFAYLAPESFAADAPDEVLCDVFSLGALLYLLFTGEDPAPTRAELLDLLHRDTGLLPSRVVDSVASELDVLVRNATHRDPGLRLGSTSELLEGLDELQEALTRPAMTSPLDAHRGDRLEHGFVVERRLGRGATAVALLVDCSVYRSNQGNDSLPERAVLKVALQPEQNARLAAEAKALQQLRHPNIVQCFGELEFDGHAALLLQDAGAPLDQRLREDGPQTEHLQRFGTELLETVRELERQAVRHRDIKPANLGIVERNKKALRLMLFDFSLADAPVSEVEVGTRRYLDPFLGHGNRRAWDPAADRYSAALTLYEIATGTLPTWGQGKSDPALTEETLELNPERFEDADRREALERFFSKALQRKAKERFDTAEALLDGWREVFRASSIEETARAGESEEGTQAEATESERDHRDPERWVDQPGSGWLDLEDVSKRALPDSSLAELGLSVRAINALARKEVHHVADLLGYDLQKVIGLRGVGTKTKNEIHRVAATLRSKFPDLEPRELPSATDDEWTAPLESDDLLVLDERTLAQHLLPKGERQVDLLRRLLHWPSEVAETELSPETQSLEARSPETRSPERPWPSQSDVATQVTITRQRLGQVVLKARGLWGKSTLVTDARNRTAELLAQRSGVDTAQRLARELAASYGAAVPEPLRTRLALVLLRAAHEAEGANSRVKNAAPPRWRERRTTRGSSGDAPLILLALDHDDRSDQRLDAAAALGSRADQLVGGNGGEVIAPARAVEELNAVVAGTPLAAASDARLVQLACDCSAHASLSSTREIYPVGLAAERALNLSFQALLTVDGLTPQQVKQRVRSRYPAAEELPGHPELADLLRSANFPLEFQGGRYRLQDLVSSSLTEGTSLATRFSTAHDGAANADDPQVESAELFEERLRRFTESGEYLVLSTDLRHYPRAADELQSDRFSFQAVDLEAELLREIEALVDQYGVPWQTIFRADVHRPENGSGDNDWRNLDRLIDQALATLRERLSSESESTSPLFLYRLGLLARYRKVAWLDRLRETFASAEPSRPVALLLASHTPDASPSVDDVPVPVLPTQWAQVPRAWLENRHRARGPSA